MKPKNWKLSGFIVLVVLGLFLAACSSGNNAATPITTPYNMATGFPLTGPTSTANAIGVLMVTHNSALGDIITDGKGMTLYVYTKDAPGISNCTNQCAVIWPPYTIAPSNSLLANPSVHGKLGNTQRPDGTYQLTIDNMPLYYYSGDKKPGDANGQGKGGVWFVLNPNAQMIQSPVATPTP